MPGPAKHSVLPVLCSHCVCVHHALTTQPNSPSKFIKCHGVFWKAFTLPGYLQIMALLQAWQQANWLSAKLLDSRLVDGDLLLFLSWLLGRVQLQSLLWFCFLVHLSHKQQQRCASQFCIDCLIFLDHTHCLHQQNLLSESVYLSTAFFIKLGFQPRNEQGRINELLSVCHSFF